MAWIRQHKGKDVVYLEPKDIVVFKTKCPKCGSTIAGKSSENWISHKCKCQCALVYPESYLEGRLQVIPLEQHLNKKEIENEIQN